MYLLDTNIFLEILLEQEKKEDFKSFIINNINNISISDFSLHSIGVILFRYKKYEIFKHFLNDIINNFKIVSLNDISLKSLENIASTLHLDFDDSYQTLIAIENKFEIVTMDKDFLIINEKKDIGVTVKFI